MEKRFVYADNAATTPLDPRVLEKMMPYLTEIYGNPSSVHQAGQRAKAAVDEARKVIADCIGAEPGEIYVTAGGSESDNWIIKELAAKNLRRGKTPHIISTAFEHHAVLHSLEESGAEVTLLPVYENGIVKPEDLEAAIKENTVLVTVMFGNNEIGSIQPIKELAEITHKHKGVIFHTDAVQALGHVPINVKEMGIDAMSFSAHKFNGPKGIGGMYMRKGIILPNLISGGGQEKGKRAGTENPAGIVGMAEALKLACENMDENTKKVTALRDKLINGILEKIPYARLNGDRTCRLPGNVNVSIPFIEGESLLLWLDINGICASSGSACTSGSLDPSHVLLSIGLTHEIAHGSLRFSLAHTNSEEDVDYILETLPGIVQRLRDMSPLWDTFVKNNGKEK